MSKRKKVTAIVPVESTAIESALKHEFDYGGEKGTYEVFSISGKSLAETDAYKLVVAKNPAGQLALAMLATTADKNEAVDRQARVLTTLQSIADEIDNESEAAGDVPPHYGAFFPMALETFRTPDDERLGVFLGYSPAISTYKQLVPLSVATAESRVDLKTSAWILGKLMKLLDYVHNCGFTIGFVDGSNVLLETALHGVFVLDWTDADEDATVDSQLAEVAKAAKLVWTAAGGTDEADPPYDESVMTKDQHGQFIEFLNSLMEGTINARTAYEQAYPLYDTIWPKEDKSDEYGTVNKRPFHNWVVYPR